MWVETAGFPAQRERFFRSRKPVFHFGLCSELQTVLSGPRGGTCEPPQGSGQVETWRPSAAEVADGCGSLAGGGVALFFPGHVIRVMKGHSAGMVGSAVVVLVS